jgi:hypothetical protein
MLAPPSVSTIVTQPTQVKLPQGLLWKNSCIWLLQLKQPVLKVKAANTLLTPFVRLLRNGHLSESEISQNIQRKYTTTSVKGQRKEGRKEEEDVPNKEYTQ